MRIASLLPAATEIVAALGAESELVGVSHECDFPMSATRLPRLTWSPVSNNGSSAAIDRQVRDLRAAGRPVIAVDGKALRATRPDLILTQDLCDVCAVTDGEVHTLADELDSGPALLPLRGRAVAGILDDIRAIADRIGRPAAGKSLVAALESRLARLAATRRGPRPRVVCVEWLEPLYLAGHWVPELVAAAGGKDVGATPGSHSVTRSWREVAALDPGIMVIALCGLTLERARVEWSRFLDSPAGVEAAVLSCRKVILDGNAYTSRPGPRIVEGAERLAQAFALRG